MPDDDSISFEDWERTARSLLAKGLVEIAGWRNGHTVYRLTEAGKRVTSQRDADPPKLKPPGRVT